MLTLCSAQKESDASRFRSRDASQDDYRSCALVDYATLPQLERHDSQNISRVRRQTCSVDRVHCAGLGHTVRLSVRLPIYVIILDRRALELETLHSPAILRLSVRLPIYVIILDRRALELETLHSPAIRTSNCTVRVSVRLPIYVIILDRPALELETLHGPAIIRLSVRLPIYVIFLDIRALELETLHSPSIRLRAEVENIRRIIAKRVFHCWYSKESNKDGFPEGKNPFIAATLLSPLSLHPV
ncbi:hypothetical protein J6590_085143 [Homalodisca vitripennis]|nr:hypothetical protein J6590_085143 [Homalodisca vitripennis]